MITKQKNYKIKSKKDIIKCLNAFNGYYSLLKSYIDSKTLKSSLDRGAFTHPNLILDETVMSLLGNNRHRISLGYGQEAGEDLLRNKIAELENLKHTTLYTKDNVVIVPGAWCGVELAIEEIINRRPGKFLKVRLVVIGPTHYQLFQRAIDVYGIDIIGIDFTYIGKPNTISSKDEVDIVLRHNPSIIFLSNPNNPNGVYCKPSVIKYLVSQTKKRKIWLIIDELQNFLPKQGLSLGYDSWIQSKYVIRIDSNSKRYALAEYRVGWVIADKKVIGSRHKGLVGRVRGLVGNAPRASNDALNILLDYDILSARGQPHPLQEKILNLEKLYECVVNRLSTNPHIVILDKDACFNVCIKLIGFKDDSTVSELLMKHGTLIMPCTGYGYDNEDCVFRITFAERTERVIHSLDTLEKVIKIYARAI
jgi:aspartate/methionine/tyrosine aminotransferase